MIASSQGVVYGLVGQWSDVLDALTLGGIDTVEELSDGATLGRMDQVRGELSERGEHVGIVRDGPMRQAKAAEVRDEVIVEQEVDVDLARSAPTMFAAAGVLFEDLELAIQLLWLSACVHGGGEVEVAGLVGAVDGCGAPGVGDLNEAKSLSQPLERGLEVAFGLDVGAEAEVDAMPGGQASPRGVSGAAVAISKCRGGAIIHGLLRRVGPAEVRTCEREVPIPASKVVGATPRLTGE